MLKVVQYIPAYNFGGIETFTYQINKELKNKCEFIYLVECNVDEKTVKKLSKNNSRIVRIPHMTREGFWKHFFAIKKFFKANKVDVLHVHDCDNRFFVMVFAKIYGVKTRIYHIHSKKFGGSIFGKFVKKIGIKINAKFATQCLSCSAEAANFKKIKQYDIVNNCINAEKFSYNIEDRKKIRSKYSIPGENKVLLFVGRVESGKNVGFLIQLMIFLKDKKCNLLIVGEGSELDNLKMMAKGLNNIVFVGRKTDVLPYYSASDFLCLPSFSEGFPMVLLEAQANGLSCIVSNNVPKNVNLNGRVKFLGIEKDDVLKWCDAILDADVVSEVDRYTGVITVKNGHDPKIIASKLLKIYNGAEK